MKTTFQRLTMLLSVMLLTVECHAQNRNAANDAFSTIMEKALFTRSLIPFQYLPEERYAVTIELAKKWETMQYQPSIDEIKKYWKERGAKNRELTESMYPMIIRKLKKQKFISENKEDIMTIRRETEKKLYDNLVKAGTIDPKSPATFVFIPLPCPDAQMYKEATSFIEAACEAALERHLSVVIVRSYYGNAKSLEKPLIKGQMWDNEILRMPDHYDKYIEAGVAKITDSFPGLTSTPWGFLFRKGQFWDEGNIASWAEDPKSILDEFKP